MHVDVSMLLVHAACPCCSSTLHLHAACPCCLSTLLVPAAGPRCMPILLIHHGLFCASIPHTNAHMSMLNVHPACQNCMSMLHVNAACPCPLMGLLLVDISTESYLFDILKHIGDQICPMAMKLTLEVPGLC
jgi:hypothetical protein